MTEPLKFFISWPFENDNIWIVYISYFINLGRTLSKNLNIEIYFKYMNRINRTSSIDFKCQIDWALKTFHSMAVWKWQYLDIEYRLFHKFGMDPQKNLNIEICFTTVEWCNRIPTIDFKCQIDQNLKIFNSMAIWKWQYLDIEYRLFHKYRTDHQKNLNI